MPNLDKISVTINGETYSISPNRTIAGDSVLVLPLRPFVGAEYYGATKNVTVNCVYLSEDEARRVIDFG